MTKGTGSRIWLGLALLTLAVSLLAGPPSALADTSNESAQSGDQAKKEKQDPATQKSPATTKDAKAPATTAAVQDDATCKPKMRFNTLEDVYGAGNLAQSRALPEALAPVPQQVTWRATPLPKAASQQPDKS